jgi:GNAT superfamily N-acetyltransferase
MDIRSVDVVKDKQTLLDFHCIINYESGSPVVRKTYTFEQFREIWMNSHQKEEFLSTFASSMEDKRTIATFWEYNSSVVAYIWVTFKDWVGFNVTEAEIRDIFVVPDLRRKGIATQVIKHVEELALEKGVTYFRSGTGSENVASQKLHAKLGFNISHIDYEKELG